MNALSSIEYLHSVASHSRDRQSLAIVDAQQTLQWRGVGFKVGPTELVASMLNIVELLPPMEYTQLPWSKNWFCGIASIRGQLVPITDMHGFFYGERQPTDRNTRVLIFRLASTVAGLVVTSVTGIRNFKEDALDRQYMMPEKPFKPFVIGCFHREGIDYPVFDFDRLISNERFMRVTEIPHQ